MDETNASCHLKGTQLRKVFKMNGGRTRKLEELEGGHSIDEVIDVKALVG